MNVEIPAPDAEQIQNGDFSAGGVGWQTYVDVNFDQERCNVGPGGAATQNLFNVPAGRYRLSCLAQLAEAMESEKATAPRISLRVNGNITSIDIENSTPETHSGIVVIPAGAEVIIYLEGNSASAWFDDVSLDLAPANENMIQNGDFSQGGNHWDPIGANYDADTCKLSGPHGISQTVMISQGGYYELKLRAKAGAGSHGMVRVEKLPSGEPQFEYVYEQDWKPFEFLLEASQGETGFRVSLLLDSGTEAEFDDVSLLQFTGDAPVRP